jgi:hypothetical protein
MSNQLDCPYCDATNTIDYDDGWGLGEDEVYEHECERCAKRFVFTTSISYVHFEEKADCLNGDAEHDMQPVTHNPRFWPDWKRCKNCTHDERGERKARDCWFTGGPLCGKRMIVDEGCMEWHAPVPESVIAKEIGDGKEFPDLKIQKVAIYKRQVSDMHTFVCVNEEEIKETA